MFESGIIIGSNMAVVAILEDISVMKFTEAITSNNTTIALVMVMELS